MLQTVLPPLLVAPSPSQLVLEGGTHNPLAPPFDFLAETFFPIVERMGGRVSARLIRPGFYPAGGGRIEVSIEPAPSLQPIELLERGALSELSAKVILANLPELIAKREIAYLQRDLGVAAIQCCVELHTDGPGPGNVVLAKVKTESHTEVFSSFGQKGVSAGSVVGTLAKEVERYLEGSGPVGVHLADQLAIPFAMAGGGAFVSTGVSPHAATNFRVVERFLDVRIHVRREARGRHLVRFEPA